MYLLLTTDFKDNFYSQCVAATCNVRDWLRAVLSMVRRSHVLVAVIKSRPVLEQWHCKLRESRDPLFIPANRQSINVCGDERCSCIYSHRLTGASGFRRCWVLELLTVRLQPSRACSGVVQGPSSSGPMGKGPRSRCVCCANLSSVGLRAPLGGGKGLRVYSLRGQLHLSLWSDRCFEATVSRSDRNPSRSQFPWWLCPPGFSWAHLGLLLF